MNQYDDDYEWLRTQKSELEPWTRISDTYSSNSSADMRRIAKRLIDTIEELRTYCGDALYERKGSGGTIDGTIFKNVSGKELTTIRPNDYVILDTKFAVAVGMKGDPKIAKIEKRISSMFSYIKLLNNRIMNVKMLLGDKS